MAMSHRRRLKAGRKGAQLVEEALLLSDSLVVLTLLVGGVESILKQSATYTSSVWNTISSSLSGIFGSLFHW